MTSPIPGNWTREVEQYGLFEVALRCGSIADPGAPAPLVLQMSGPEGEPVGEAAGFWDGGNVYRARWMPDRPGRWRFATQSAHPELITRGEFDCGPAPEGSHGPVLVASRHFRHVDGAPHFSFGTTCYAWVHQPIEVQEQTLRTLAEAPFNKLRMCVFPKHYRFNENEPPMHPYPAAAEGGRDFRLPDPAFFQLLDRRVADLARLGVQADVILFHPYDRWGYPAMNAHDRDRYLRYVVARLAAFANVWWSLANEYDFQPVWSEEDWDGCFRVVQAADPHGRLRSIHNGVRWYDHGKPWVTHVSAQSSELRRVAEWRDRWNKPVVVDECCYEGNIETLWGNLTAEEMAHRFWLGTIGGGYVGHGETYLHPSDELWWSKGGVLRGESAPRIAFLRRIVEEGPPTGYEPVRWRSDMWAAARDETEFLFYFGARQPAEYTFDPPVQRPFRVDILDTWGMAVTPVEGVRTPPFRLEMPGRPYTAVRLRAAE
ncbi:MAG TPA: DUF4038 domain-containing protein [Chthonomonadales bacterium]|nr:DUF4038 domain-containing protein [Chthonomonadales bacterium]